MGPGVRPIYKRRDLPVMNFRCHPKYHFAQTGHHIIITAMHHRRQPLCRQRGHAMLISQIDNFGSTFRLSGFQRMNSSAEERQPFNPARGQTNHLKRHTRAHGMTGDSQRPLDRGKALLRHLRYMILITQRGDNHRFWKILRDTRPDMTVRKQSRDQYTACHDVGGAGPAGPRLSFQCYSDLVRQLSA